MRSPIKGLSERRSVLIRLDPAIHDAVARWAQDELRSSNAQIEFLLRSALVSAGRLPRALVGERRNAAGSTRPTLRRKAG
ncbi:MAG: hypothetical protein ACREOY_05855 [Candidatus Dormibacteraceae bacterium]